MDNHIPCYCGSKRVNPDDANMVLNGIPVCDRACLAKAEKEALKGHEPKRRATEWSWNGA